MTVPTKWTIAQHWADSPDRFTFAPCLVDLGEPCCFACGYYSERWDKGTPYSSWKRATLERAHIVPSSLGGSDDASNIILLCAPCHRDAPDWPDPSEMALWIADRPERSSKEFEDLEGWNKAFQAVPGFADLLAVAEADPDVPDGVAVQRLIDLVWESARRAGLHSGELSQGTKVAIVRDAIQRANADSAAA
jgi:hypothetical protein